MSDTVSPFSQQPENSESTATRLSTVAHGSALEISHTPEAGEDLLPQSDRIVVYGSRGSGAGELSVVLREALAEQGITEDKARIDYTRHISGIEPVFFGETLQRPVPERSSVPAEPLGIEPRQTATQALVRRVKTIFNGIPKPEKTVVSTGSIVESNELRESPEVEDKYKNTRPRGVLIFPEMRWFDEYTQSNMTLPTPTDRIVTLCEDNQVPYVLVKKINGDFDVRGAVRELINSLPPQKGEVDSEQELVRTQEDPTVLSIGGGSMDVVSNTTGEVNTEYDSEVAQYVQELFNGEDPDALFIFSAGTRKSPVTGQYRAIAWLQPGELGLHTGARTRVAAGAKIAHLFPKARIVTNSYDRTDTTKPTMAETIEEELTRHYGIDGARIEREEESFSTITQLVEMAKLLDAHDWKDVAIVVSDYHIPRTTALFERLDQLVDDPGIADVLRRIRTAGKKVRFIGAESILEMMGPHYIAYVKASRESAPYKEIAASEKQGLEDLLAGKYRLAHAPAKPVTKD